MTNPTGAWALENGPALAELQAAVEQLSLEAGAGGDSVLATGSIAAAAPSLDVACERVARAARQVRLFPPPPDRSSAQHLVACLAALDACAASEARDVFISHWVLEMVHLA